MHILKLNDATDSSLVRDTVHRLFQNKQTELIKRPASFILKLKHEPEEKVFRIILLPPNGYTSNNVDETSPHPEMRRAKIAVKGGIKLNKSGFSILKNVIRYQYYTNRDIKIVNDFPYPKIGGTNYKEKLISTKEKLFVVRENGVGFYHNLVNLSNEWILLVLEKELRLQKEPNIEQMISTYTLKDQKVFHTLYTNILRYGDVIFEQDSRFITKVYNFDVAKSIPPLIEMLNVFETGKHEPCTVFGIILKIGKKNRLVVSTYLKEAITEKTAPRYYLEELLKKLR